MMLRRRSAANDLAARGRASGSQLIYYMLGSLCASLLVGGAALRSAPPSLLFNPSHSAPRGWYLLNPGAPTRVGQFALARLPQSVAALADYRRYLPRGTLLLKRVAAIHGDYVCAAHGVVRINRRLAAATLQEDSQHRMLTEWDGCRLLAADEFFLLSATSAASFDSRYFGPLELAAIQGRAVPLWTWP